MEKSIEYRMIGSIRHNNETFNIYQDKMYRKFYLKNIGKCLMYPTLEEFQELNKIFTKSTLNFSKSIKESTSISAKVIKFIPKVIYRGELISLLAAIMMTQPSMIIEEKHDFDENNIGYHDSIDDDEFNEEIVDVNESNNITIDKSKEQTTEESIEQATKSIFEMSDREYLEYKGVKFEEIGEGIFVAKEVIGTNGVRNVFFQTDEEFKNFIGIHKKITFDDLRQAINERQDIEEKYKEWISYGIDNLEKSGLFEDYDFSVLYSNLKKFTIENKNEKEIKEFYGENIIASFNELEAKVVINSESVDLSCFLHEILGHGITEWRQKIDGTIYYRISKTPILTIYSDSENKGFNCNGFGNGMSEACATIITHLADGNYEKGCFDYFSYPLQYEQFRVYSALSGTNLTDFLSGGTKLLINNMNSVGIKKAMERLASCDFLTEITWKGCDAELSEEVTSKYNIKEAIMEYANNGYENGILLEDIKENINNIKSNALFTDTSTPYDSLCVFEYVNEILEELDRWEYTEQTEIQEEIEEIVETEDEVEVEFTTQVDFEEIDEPMSAENTESTAEIVLEEQTDLIMGTTTIETTEVITQTTTEIIDLTKTEMDDETR